jgi:hypothetical protein
VLHRFFDKHADKIGKELLSLSKPSSEGDKSAVNGKRAWDGLCALLVDLGPPLEVPRPSNYTSQEHGEYIDLMSDYNGRNTSRVRELFVEMDEIWVSGEFQFQLFVLLNSIRMNMPTLSSDWPKLTSKTLTSSFSCIIYSRCQDSSLDTVMILTHA